MERENTLCFIIFTNSIIDDDDFRPSTASGDQTRERKLAELVCSIHQFQFKTFSISLYYLLLTHIVAHAKFCKEVINYFSIFVSLSIQ